MEAERLGKKFIREIYCHNPKCDHSDELHDKNGCHAFRITTWSFCRCKKFLRISPVVKVLEPMLWQ